MASLTEARVTPVASNWVRLSHCVSGLRERRLGLQNPFMRQAPTAPPVSMRS